MVIVSLLCASSAGLGVFALECLVSHLLAVVTLLRALSSLEYPRVARLASGVKETLLEELPRLGGLRQVDDHGTVCLPVVLPAQPCHLGDCRLVLLSECLGRSVPDPIVFVEDCCAPDAIHLNWSVLGLISADDFDALGLPGVYSHGTASPVLLFSRRSHLLLNRGSNRLGGHSRPFIVHPGGVNRAVQSISERGGRRFHRGKRAYVARLARRGRACDSRVGGLRARLGAAGEGRAVPEFFQLLGDILKLGGELLDDCLLVVDDLFQVSDLVTRVGHELVDALQHLRVDGHVVARACLRSIVAYIRE
ncbi:hypothetical protein PG991_009220 [Apiospora marii]|uniref:Secreted protein n=1 Tax=Apiospora marii TaxID=335849 RepID=A0ABR1RL40_9PEZI